jgi:hypothetical protein
LILSKLVLSKLVLGELVLGELILGKLILGKLILGKLILGKLILSKLILCKLPALPAAFRSQDHVEHTSSFHNRSDSQRRIAKIHRLPARLTLIGSACHVDRAGALDRLWQRLPRHGSGFATVVLPEAVFLGGHVQHEFGLDRKLGPPEDVFGACLELVVFVLTDVALADVVFANVVLANVVLTALFLACLACVVPFVLAFPATLGEAGAGPALVLGDRLVLGEGTLLRPVSVLVTGHDAQIKEQ